MKMSRGIIIKDSKEAFRLMDELDKRNISYQVWNAEEVIFDTTGKIPHEIEVENEDWYKFSEIVEALNIQSLAY